MNSERSLLIHIENFIAAKLQEHLDKTAAGRFDAAGFETNLLDELAAHGLRIEDFTESEYMSFELSGGGTKWSLVIHEFDERTGPYQRTLEFDSQNAARKAVLDIVLPTMRNYGELADVAWPARSESRPWWKVWARD